MDREKVIKAYECCKNSYDRMCEKCPYEKDCCHDGIPMFVIKKMVELLKEQEEKQTPKQIIHGYKEEYWGEEEICPVCGKRWQSANINSTHFCPGCGQAVFW